MRRRTPSEIKAYGDGYAEAYKEFSHLLKNHDVNKAMRKMKIFADAVALTVETATDEPQTERYCTNCKHNGVIEDYECRECNGMDNHEFIEPQTEVDWKDQMWAEAVEASKTEPQIDIHDLTDCDFCKDRNCKDCEGGKNEPQTERSE